MIARMVMTVLVFLAGCSIGAPKPEVSLVDAVVTDVSVLETGMQFTLRLTNNTPDTMEIDGAVHKIFINGREVGSGASGETIELPRFSSETQTIRIGISNLEMLGNVRSLVDSKKFDYRVESKFYMKGSAFPWAVDAVKSDRFGLPVVGERG